MTENRPQGRVFGEVADTYDRVRPIYPDDLYRRLADVAGLRDGDRVLEVGAGTGKATAALVAMGWDVTAVEPDPSMAEVLTSRVPDARVITAPFEDADLEGPFALVAAAQSWHWVDPDRGFARAAQLLVPHGTLATWWNLSAGTDDALASALDEVYAQHAPEMASGHWHRPAAGLDDEDELPVWPDPFEEVTVAELRWRTSYTVDQYVALLSTQSDHRLLASEQRDRLLEAVREVADDHGEQVEVGYVCRLHHAASEV